MTAPKLWDNLRIVLMETSHPGNIGAVARGMKNMGLSNLYLVNPEQFPDPVAERRASGALDLLNSARVCSSLDEALADCVLVMGASARNRRLTWPVVDPEAGAGLAREWIARGPVALLFGREDRGLSNEELQRCHYHVHIPANPDYSALNLAMAVQILAYELRKVYLKEAQNPLEAQLTRPILSPQDGGWDMEAATVEEVDGFLDHLERVLVRIDFHDPDNPRQLMTRLRRLYQRAHLDRMEINILRGMLTNVQQRTPEPAATSKSRGGSEASDG